jgi:hypothetical protein
MKTRFMSRFTSTVPCTTTLVLTIALAGCQSFRSPVQRIANAPAGQLNDTPMIVDQAMQIRDWDRSSAYYTNTMFEAGSVGFLYEPRYDNPGWSYAAIEPPLFAAQVVALPVTIWFPPPWAPVNYASERVEPTYHGVPPLPPSQAAAPATPVEPAAPSEPMTPAEPAPPASAPGN